LQIYVPRRCRNPLLKVSINGFNQGTTRSDNPTYPTATGGWFNLNDRPQLDGWVQTPIQRFRRCLSIGHCPSDRLFPIRLTVPAKPNVGFPSDGIPHLIDRPPVAVRWIQRVFSSFKVNQMFPIVIDHPIKLIERSGIVMGYCFRGPFGIGLSQHRSRGLLFDQVINQVIGWLRNSLVQIVKQPFWLLLQYITFQLFS
jgi:hypothetical protein